MPTEVGGVGDLLLITSACVCPPDGVAWNSKMSFLHQVMSAMNKLHKLDNNMQQDCIVC